MLQTKALYNLLRLRRSEDPSVKVDLWALEDLRNVGTNELFSRLSDESVRLDKISFAQFADQCDTPEDLTELLFPDNALEEKKDPFYLVVFELWRRLLPEKQSLSIFCDELDYQIALYDDEKLESDEPIQDALANFLEILEENVDAGANPQTIFSAISDYCAHDLESFIYDYVIEVLDGKNLVYASELIEDFSPYVKDPLWFDFLNLRLLTFSDVEAANIKMHELLKKSLDLPLLLEIIRFSSETGEQELFKLSVKKALPLIKDKEERDDVLSEIADYYHRLDEDEKGKAIERLMNPRGKGPLDPADLKTLQELLI